VQVQLNQHLQKIINKCIWELTVIPKVKKANLLLYQRNTFQHKPRTFCASEVLSISILTFLFSKLSAWEIQLWLNSRIRSQHAKPVGQNNRKLKAGSCGKMGWLLVSLRNYKKDHCSLTLVKKIKKEKKKKRKMKENQCLFFI